MIRLDAIFLTISCILRQVHSFQAHQTNLSPRATTTTATTWTVFSTTATQSNSELFTVSKTDEEDQPSIDDITNKILIEGFVDEGQAGWIVPIIHSLSKQGTTASAETVTKVLTQLEDQVDSGILNEKSLRCTHYGVAIEAWAKSGNKSSPQKADELVSRMMARGIKLNRVVCNSWMYTHTFHNNLERVKEILEMMEREIPDQINISDYNILIHGHAKLGQAMEAERIVKGLVDRYNKGEIKCLPDRLSYNLILDSWAKSDFDQCGTRAEMILDALEQRKDDPKFFPDRRSYGSAMSAVVRSKEDNIAERVEAIYERALSRGIDDCPYMISTVLDAYATANPNVVVKRVEELLERTYEIDVDQEGITVVYNTALKVFKEAQNREGFLRAEKLFEKMKAEGYADTVSYSTIVTMYANQGGKSLEARVENMLQEMNEAGIQCTTHCLNAFITFWTRYGKQAKAEVILRQMEQAYFDGRYESHRTLCHIQLL